MAATCGVKVSRGLLKSHLVRGISLFLPRQSSGQQRFTWSQLKHVHSRSVVATPFRFQHSSRTRWQWLVMAMTAGFSQGFLGINLGKKDEEKKEDPLLRVFREAKEAHTKQDFNKAEIRYHDALKVADEMLKLKRINFKTYLYAKINVYGSLGDMALGLGQLEKAEGLYKETIKGCLQQGLPQDDNAIIELSLKLASIYAMMDRKPEAEQGLLFCIQAQDAKLVSNKSKSDATVPEAVKEAKDSTGTDSKQHTAAEMNNDLEAKLKEEEKAKDTEALLGMALETYGRFLMGLRRLTEAVAVLERASGIGERVLGTDHGQYIILLNDLATAHILLKQFDAATGILNKAIAYASEAKSSQLPVLYCNLGAVFLRTSKLDSAETACLKGQELSSKGKNTMAFTMAQKCLQKIGQVRKAT